MDENAALFAAIDEGDAEKVQALLAEQPELAAVRNEQEVSVLLYAVYRGQHAIRDLILAQRPLLSIWEAAAVGDLARVQALIAGDATLLNATAPDGFHLLGLAAFFGHVELLAWLLTEGADANAPAANAMRVRPIHSAAAHRQPHVALTMVQSLLDHGADVNVVQHGGWTPLHQAAAHGQQALVELLLVHGADPTATSEDGRTPAEMAQANGHTVVFRKR